VKAAIPSERFWRRPLDADEILRTRGHVTLREERCKGCNYCVDFCPRGVLKASTRFNTKGYHPPEVVAPDACTGCHLCESLCPEFAIGVREENYKERNHVC
jgi:2-oxoglutarate ferredoxin oxidoreductase subunit delta